MRLKGRFTLFLFLLMTFTPWVETRMFDRIFRIPFTLNSYWGPEGERERGEGGRGREIGE